MEGAPIVSGDGQKGTIFFTDKVLDNSFWAEQGVQPNDVIKKIDGSDLTLANANELLQQVFLWQPGKDVEVVLDRGGEEVLIKTTTTKTYTTGKGIMEKADATDAQKSLREAWLRG